MSSRAIPYAVSRVVSGRVSGESVPDGRSRHRTFSEGSAALAAGQPQSLARASVIRCPKWPVLEYSRRK
jgi:hypothetical protein